MIDADPPCRLMLVATTDIDDRWHYSLSDPFWRLYRNDASGAAILYPGGRHALLPERLHLVPPWGRFQATCRGRIGHSYMHVDAGDWATGCFSRPIALSPNTDREALFARLVATPTPSLSDRLQARALFLACLAEAVTELPAQIRAGIEDAASGPVERARQFIVAHLGDPLTLGGIAARCGISPGHLNHCFRQHCGHTVMATVRARRVAAAAERLILGDTPIEDIAEAVGFRNRYHFTRIFTRLTGIGPATYRKRHRPQGG